MLILCDDSRPCMFYNYYIRDSAGTQREKIMTSAKNTPPLPIFAKKKVQKERGGKFACNYLWKRKQTRNILISKTGNPTLPMT